MNFSDRCVVPRLEFKAQIHEATGRYRTMDYGCEDTIFHRVTGSLRCQWTEIRILTPLSKQRPVFNPGKWELVGRQKLIHELTLKLPFESQRQYQTQTSTDSKVGRYDNLTDQRRVAFYDHDSDMCYLSTRLERKFTAQLKKKTSVQNGTKKWRRRRMDQIHISSSRSVPGLPFLF